SPPRVRRRGSATPWRTSASTRRRPLSAAAPCTLLEPARAACEALAVIVLAGDLAAVAVEHDPRRGATAARAARVPQRVGPRGAGVDGRARHGRASPSSIGVTMPAAVGCEARLTTDPTPVRCQLRAATADPAAIRCELRAPADPGPIGRQL